ncbi:MAG: MiaB/RimO family radical SAM methylthiotransferase [Kiritimatiellaeota bacterium]|nr:MiaB/RimO family radical SAM methylthiotransferase [Kiritimatiellota bacterium]
MRVGFVTLGCRLNQTETAMMAGQCEAAGFAVVSPGEAADVLVVQSCAVTHAAEHEAFRVIRRLRRRVPSPIIVVTGCVTALHDEARFRDEGADIVVPQLGKERMADIIRASTAFPPLGGRDATDAVVPRFFTTRASVKIQDGCDFRCAYCIVPDTRGASVSRPLAAILAEATAVAARHREIVLTGVNVAAYRRPEATFFDVVRQVLAIPSVGRLRLSSIEPGHGEREIARLMADAPRLCRMLHYPLQSGDDGVLRLMRRRYTVAEYCDALEDMLGVVPAVGLGTDVITGFPGETDAAFDNTRKIVERYPFSNLHVFPYSERPGTPAATLPGSVPIAVRRERAAILSALGETKRRAFAQSFIGTSVDVLVEKWSAPTDQWPEGRSCGWTSEYLEATLSGHHPIGDIVSFTPRSLSAIT